MLEVLAAAVAGCLAGVATGLLPGIHPNTVAFSLLPVYLSGGPGFSIFSAFLVALAVSHSFHGFLPAVYLGVAEAESALASLPGAELASEGRGREAFLATARGGAVAVTAVTLLAPAIYAGMAFLQSALEPVMAQVLLFFMALNVHLSDSRVKAAAVTALSAALGFLAFRMPVNQSYVLVPVFSGLFAVPALGRLLISGAGLPEQEAAAGTGEGFRGGLLGVPAGVLSGFLPGVSAATATALLSPAIGSEREFLGGMGAVNTADILVSLIALQAIGRARSGTAVALDGLRGIDPGGAAFLYSCALLSAGISLPASFSVSRVFAGKIGQLDSPRLAVAVIVLLAATSYFLTGFLGLLVLATASAVGSAAALSSARRCTMACLMAVAALHYAGFSV